MFYRRQSRWTQLRVKFFGGSTFRFLKEFVAGIDAGHGIAHGITPPPQSRARAQPAHETRESP
ncbi:hypothetical protein CRI77_04155 [Mycolicibacterium duvalii]|uniref:Uncharacterized protein n=1 Tax=Mycolicibacterium duvalii TaxID=39688 RepID=A0A7I7K9M9_9MYCO|nr:hypothetical protein [Mycolicibacterium duvalii]MCV7366429.1 hypothetical protein [Mycolicibacterium duvalii]PEG43779.1 hypothetical protein CRI77_04155 [Mycolicibacterium duvalii]BBX20259.1 hypothetical protein MDUV_51190 [Mycolicibacterium duvalii]